MVNESLIKVAPSEQNYSAQPIQVEEHLATADSVTNNILAQNKTLNNVNNLTRGGGKLRRGTSRSKKMRNYHRRYIRTNKRRLQRGGEPGVIPIAQAPGHPSCSSGPQCPGAHNALFTSISNQLESNGKNDGLMGGSRRQKRNKYSKRKNFRNNKKSVRKNRK
jgi:hypothetical protein